MLKYTLRARLEPSGAHEAVEGRTGDARELSDGGFGNTQIKEAPDLVTTKLFGQNACLFLTVCDCIRPRCLPAPPESARLAVDITTGSRTPARAAAASLHSWP